MKKVSILFTAAILLSVNAFGQLVRLNSEKSKNALYFDLDRVFNYNLYEHARWGGGLRYDINFSKKRFKTLSFGGYLGYGYEDQRIKWGVRSELCGSSQHRLRLYTDFIHDLTPDAGRNLLDYSVADFTATGSFMARRFSDAYRWTLGMSRRQSKDLTLSAEGRLSFERRLYDYWGLIYPESDSVWRELPSAFFSEARFCLSYKEKWSTEILLGTRIDNPMLVARLLSQYDNTLLFSFFKLHLFAQAGITPENTPYSRMFDLGGSWGSPLYFQRSLVTARHNEFTANVFSMVAMRLTTRKPLFDLYSELFQIGTNPVPFVMLNAAWGRLWNEDGDGLKIHNALILMSPTKGIAEVGAGINGLLRFGNIDWGGMVAYRLSPASAFYHFSDPKDNLSWLVTASLHL